MHSQVEDLAFLRWIIGESLNLNPSTAVNHREMGTKILDDREIAPELRYCSSLSD
jgi:hypothetical protein